MYYLGDVANDLRQYPSTNQRFLALRQEFITHWTETLQSWNAVTRNIGLRKYSHDSDSPYAIWTPLPILKSSGQRDPDYLGLKIIYMPLPTCYLLFPIIRYVPNSIDNIS